MLVLMEGVPGGLVDLMRSNQSQREPLLRWELDVKYQVHHLNRSFDDWLQLAMNVVIDSMRRDSLIRG